MISIDNCDVKISVSHFVVLLMQNSCQFIPVSRVLIIQSLSWAVPEVGVGHQRDISIKANTRNDDRGPDRVQGIGERKPEPVVTDLDHEIEPPGTKSAGLSNSYENREIDNHVKHLLAFVTKVLSFFIQSFAKSYCLH